MRVVVAAVAVVLCLLGEARQPGRTGADGSFRRPPFVMSN